MAGNYRKTGLTGKENFTGECGGGKVEKPLLNPHILLPSDLSLSLYPSSKEGWLERSLHSRARCCKCEYLHDTRGIAAFTYIREEELWDKKDKGEDTGIWKRGMLKVRGITGRRKTEQHQEGQSTSKAAR